MSKVTSKFQVTIPRSIARAHGIGPGSEIVFESAGEVIRIRHGEAEDDESAAREEAVRNFDAATKRQAAREAALLERLESGGVPGKGRGWTRDELYEDRTR